jgi:hypothetical protein
MSVRALVGITPEWWTPETETEPDTDGHIAERPAAFYLHPLTGPQMMEVQEFFDLENRTIKTGGLLRAARFGLKDWRNVLDENDKEIDFDASLNKLPAEWIANAGAQIIANSVISEETEKN